MTDVRPFVVPDPSTIALGAWVVDDVDGEDLPEAWDGWDANTDIRIRRTCEIDMHRLRVSAGLPADVPVRVTTSWKSSATQMRLRAGSIPVVGDGRHTLKALLPGAQVAGTLVLRTSVTVGADWDGPAGLACRAGSVLLEDEVRIALQGESPMFPIEILDFATTPWDDDASWHLTVASDLEAPFLGACWLSLNSRDSELISAVSAAKANQRQEALLETLYGGVAELMLEMAEIRSRDPEAAGATFEPDSVGAVLSHYASALGQSVYEIASTMPEAADRHSARQGATRRMGLGRRFK